MKKAYLLFLVFAVLFCQAAFAQKYYRQAKAQVADASSQEALQKLTAKIETLQYRIDLLSRQNQKLQGDIDDQRRRVQSSPAVSENDLKILQDRLDALERARVKDRQVIIGEISKQVATMIKGLSRNSRRNGTKSTSGYEHSVEAGDTLSTIAEAYKVTVKCIKGANKIKDNDVILIGQILFIPKKC